MKSATLGARPLTPKEFAESLGGVRSPDWIRAECNAGRIRTVNGKKRPPYLIPATELEKFGAVFFA